MVNILPGILAPRGNYARVNLGDAFKRYFEQYRPGQTQSSAFTLHRHLTNTKYDVTPWNAARLEVGVLLGVLANMIPTMFWMIIHVYSDGKLLQQIRQEVEATCIRSSSDGLRRSLRVISLREKCPLLRATFKEALRHYALGSSARYVREDILLDGKYLLKQGMVVQIPMAVLHHNHAAWGDDTATFHPNRFLKDNTDGKGGLKQDSSAFRPFGGGASMCPGRHLAALETCALTAYMALRFDMKPIDGTWTIPKPQQESLATNVFPPGEDIRVQIVTREGFEGVHWEISMD